MPTIDRIRELCARVVRSEGADFKAALLELMNAIDSYEASQEQKNDKKAEIAD